MQKNRGGNLCCRYFYFDSNVQVLGPKFPIHNFQAGPRGKCVSYNIAEHNDGMYTMNHIEFTSTHEIQLLITNSRSKL